MNILLQEIKFTSEISQICLLHGTHSDMYSRHNRKAQVLLVKLIIAEFQFHDAVDMFADTDSLGHLTRMKLLLILLVAHVLSMLLQVRMSALKQTCFFRLQKDLHSPQMGIYAFLSFLLCMAAATIQYTILSLFSLWLLHVVQHVLMFLGWAWLHQLTANQPEYRTDS